MESVFMGRFIPHPDEVPVELTLLNLSVFHGNNCTLSASGASLAIITAPGATARRWKCACRP
jgi:hypothetical protein